MLRFHRKNNGTVVCSSNAEKNNNRWIDVTKSQSIKLSNLSEHAKKESTFNEARNNDGCMLDKSVSQIGLAIFFGAFPQLSGDHENSKVRV